MNIVISWFTDMVSPSSETEDQPATMLSSVYHNFRQVNGAKDVALSSSPSAKVNGGRPPIMLLGQRRQLLDETLSDAAASLLVATHSGLSSDDWTVVLPRIWLLSGEHGIRTKAVGYAWDLDCGGADSLRSHFSLISVARLFRLNLQISS